MTIPPSISYFATLLYKQIQKNNHNVESVAYYIIHRDQYSNAKHCQKVQTIISYSF